MKAVTTIVRKVTTLILFGIGSCLFSVCSEVSAQTYYVSPIGSDSNPGTSSQPWRTWAFALAQLDPSETLIAKDGTWTNRPSCSGLATPCLANAGLPYVNCAAGHRNGTAAQPITIKAENERQAFLKSDGSTHAFSMRNCSYWNVVGLRGASTDKPGPGGRYTYSYVFIFGHTDHITARRLLAARPNRYGNNHAIGFNYSSNVLVEESEAYWFHRWGIVAFLSDSVTMRRNYANSRDYPDLPDGYPSKPKNTGDFGMGFYASDDAVPLRTSNSIIENSISENNSTGFNLGASLSSGFNKILGSIAISNSIIGAIGGDRGAAGFNGLMQNSVFVSNNYGIQFRSGTNMRAENVTIYNNILGIYMDDTPEITSKQNNEFRSTFVTNALLFNNSGNAFDVRNQDKWLVEYTNSVDNGGTEWPVVQTISDNVGHIRNSISITPTGIGLGTNQCIVYVPPGSNMKDASENGADIGANIVYRYENGVLTSQNLWNQATGQFPCGATVTGVNDDASFPNSSCVNVHTRLNVGVNGCPIP